MIQLTTDEMLIEMAAIFKERNTQYGNNYDMVGEVLAALFPHGIVLKTKDDFIKFHFLDWVVGKLTRFVKSGLTHVDSAQDGGVYFAMLADLVTKLKEREDDKRGNSDDLSRSYAGTTSSQALSGHPVSEGDWNR